MYEGMFVRIDCVSSNTLLPLTPWLQMAVRSIHRSDLSLGNFLPAFDHRSTPRTSCTKKYLPPCMLWVVIDRTHVVATCVHAPCDARKPGCLLGSHLVLELIHVNICVGILYSQICCVLCMDVIKKFGPRMCMHVSCSRTSVSQFAQKYSENLTLFAPVEGVLLMLQQGWR